MANIRRSLIINFFSSSGATLLKFAVSVIIARILSPSDIGVFSITVVFVNIAQIFRDFGVSSYLQREKELTPDKLRSAMGVAFASSWLLALFLFVASGYVADWFAEPQMIPVMRVLALGFMLIPFSSVTQALMTREFRADTQAWVVAAGTSSYCASCLILAWMGFGSLSLAWANVINILVCALAYIPLRPKSMPWLPGFRHWRSVVSFGLGSLISNCAIAIEQAIPDVLLGKLGNASMVGLYSRANSTVAIFTHVAGSTVSYGAVSYLSKSYHKGESLVPTLTRATALLTGVGWSALALTAVLGRDIVLALYGPKWLDSVAAIVPLTCAAAIAMLFHYTPIALTAMGRPYLGAVPVCVTIASRVLFGWLLFDQTLATFAWAMLFAAMAAAPVMAYQQYRYFHLTVLDNLRALAPSALVAAASAASAFLLDLALPAALPSLTRLLLMALPIAAVWYAALRLVKHTLIGEIHQIAGGVAARFRRTA